MGGNCSREFRPEAEPQPCYFCFLNRDRVSDRPVTARIDAAAAGQGWHAMKQTVSRMAQLANIAERLTPPNEVQSSGWRAPPERR